MKKEFVTHLHVAFYKMWTSIFEQTEKKWKDGKSLLVKLIIEDHQKVGILRMTTRNIFWTKKTWASNWTMKNFYKTYKAVQ